jgi:hypothetical protein
VPESSIATARDAWSATAIGDWNDTIEQVIDDLNSNDLPLVVFSRGLVDDPGGRPDFAPSYQAVTEGQTDARFTSQRRRNFN